MTSWKTRSIVSPALSVRGSPGVGRAELAHAGTPRLQEGAHLVVVDVALAQGALHEDAQVEQAQVAGGTEQDLLGLVDRQAVDRVRGSAVVHQPRAHEPRPSRRGGRSPLDRGEHRHAFGQLRQLPPEQPGRRRWVNRALRWQDQQPGLELADERLVRVKPSLVAGRGRG